MPDNDYNLIYMIEMGKDESPQQRDDLPAVVYDLTSTAMEYPPATQVFYRSYCSFHRIYNLHKNGGKHSYADLKDMQIHFSSKVQHVVPDLYYEKNQTYKYKKKDSPAKVVSPSLHPEEYNHCNH